jgi:hypothetical protein
MDWCTDCDFGHVNAGALRANLFKHDLANSSDPLAEISLRRGDLAQVLRFGNSLMTYSVYGRNFRAFMLNFALTEWGTGGWPQFSGLRWARNPAIPALEEQVVAVLTRNRHTGAWVPMDLDRTYKVVTINFFFSFSGGDGYPLPQHVQVLQPFGPGDIDTLVRWMQSPRFVPPPSMEQMSLCNHNNSFVLRTTATAGGSGGGGTSGNLTWPLDHCSAIMTSGVRAQECPSNPNFCAMTEVAYTGKAVNQSNCDNCSGLGTCITFYGRCACDRPVTSGLFKGIVMLAGEDCATVREEWKLNVAASGFLYACSLLVIALAIVTSIWLYFNRKARVVKRASTLFLQLACAGALLAGLCSVVILTPTSDASCTASTWLGHFAFCLMFGSLFAKTWRISAIFLNKKLSTLVLTDRQLLLRLSLLFLLELTLRLVEIGASPLHRQARSLDLGGCADVGPTLQDLLDGGIDSSNGGSSSFARVPTEFKYFFTCGSGAFQIIDAVAWTYKGLFTLWGVLLAYRIKSVDADFNESKLLALLIYQMVLLSLLAKVLIELIGERSPGSVLVIEVLAIDIVAASVVLGLAVPKWMVIRREGAQAGPSSNSNAHAGGGNDPTGAAGQRQQTMLQTKLDGGGMMDSNARVAPATFRSSLETIRARLRGAASGERSVELPQFLDAAQKFVDQLQALKAQQPAKRPSAIGVGLSRQLSAVPSPKSPGSSAARSSESPPTSSAGASSAAVAGTVSPHQQQQGNGVVSLEGVELSSISGVASSAGPASPSQASAAAAASSIPEEDEGDEPSSRVIAGGRAAVVSPGARSSSRTPSLSRNGESDAAAAAAAETAPAHRHLSMLQQQHEQQRPIDDDDLPPLPPPEQ